MSLGATGGRTLLGFGLHLIVSWSLLYLCYYIRIGVNHIGSYFVWFYLSAYLAYFANWIIPIRHIYLLLFVSGWYNYIDRPVHKVLDVCCSEFYIGSSVRLSYSLLPWDTAFVIAAQWLFSKQISISFFVVSNLLVWFSGEYILHPSDF